VKVLTLVLVEPEMTEERRRAFIEVKVVVCVEGGGAEGRGGERWVRDW
jgi:hypothetical protein